MPLTINQKYVTSADRLKLLSWNHDNFLMSIKTIWSSCLKQWTVLVSLLLLVDRWGVALVWRQVVTWSCVTVCAVVLLQVVFSRFCSPCDIKELFCTALGVPRYLPTNPPPLMFTMEIKRGFTQPLSRESVLYCLRGHVTPVWSLFIILYNPYCI